MQNSMERRLGNYMLSRLLGRGGFAHVYYGEHVYLKTSAAIKVLNVRITSEEHEKFLQEARIAAHLEHPNIISVLEFGVEQDVPYLVMDYASSGTLRQHHPKSTRLPLHEVATYVKQIASALQYTHTQNLIHRDVKPENMLLGDKGNVLLSDFGIALVVEKVQKGSGDRHMVGTILYMAPEQIRGEPCPASDQYALASVIYEWLCGSPPFYGSYTEVAVQHALVAPEPIRQHVPQLPALVEEVLMIALSKRPEARFKSMNAFAHAFAYACESPHLVTGILVEPSIERPMEVAPLPKKSSRRVFVASTLSGVGLIAAGALGWKPLSQEIHHLLTPQPTHPITKKPILTPAGTTLYTFHGHAYDGGFAWLPGSKRIASAGVDVQIWDALTGRHGVTYHVGHFSNAIGTFTAAVDRMALSPDGKYIVVEVVGNDGSTEIHIWDAATGKNMPTYPVAQTYQATAFAWSPDSTSLAIADNSASSEVQIWNVISGKQLVTYKGHTSSIASISWSPDGKLIASVEGGINFYDPTPSVIHIWEADTGQVHMMYHGHPDLVSTVAWSPQGTLLASAGGTSTAKSGANYNTVQVWSPENDKPILVYSGHIDGPATTVSWSPSGKYIVSGGGVYNTAQTVSTATALVWDAQSGKTLLNYQGHNHVDMSGVSQVAWSPDGTLIASAGFDNTIQVWKAVL